MNRVPFTAQGDLPSVSAVYFVVDASGLILYIGASKSLLRRWKGTHHHKAAFAEYGASEIRWVETPRGSLASAERDAINQFAPILNRGCAAYALRPDSELAQMHVPLPPPVFQAIKKLAAKERRTISAEIVIAVEAHIKSKGKSK